MGRYYLSVADNHFSGRGGDVCREDGIPQSWNKDTLEYVVDKINNEKDSEDERRKIL